MPLRHILAKALHRRKSLFGSREMSLGYTSTSPRPTLMRKLFPNKAPIDSINKREAKEDAN